MTMIRYEIVKMDTAHGFSVNVVKYNDQLSEKLESGFTLHTFDTKEEQETYAQDLAKMLAFPLVDEMSWPFGIGENLEEDVEGDELQGWY